MPIDGFILALVFVLLAATLLPCQGEGARWLGLLGKCAVGALFFLQGARLSGQTVLNGVTHWRLHLFVGAATFLVFPLFGLGMLAVFPYSPPTIVAGRLVCLRPAINGAVLDSPDLHGARQCIRRDLCRNTIQRYRCCIDAAPVRGDVAFTRSRRRRGGGRAGGHAVIAAIPRRPFAAAVAGRVGRA